MFTIRIASYPRAVSISFFFNATPPTEIYTLSLHDALPISIQRLKTASGVGRSAISTTLAPTLKGNVKALRSEEHTSELQSLRHLVCRLLLEKKKKKQYKKKNNDQRSKRNYDEQRKHQSTIN